MFTMQLAGVAFTVHNRYSYVAQLCRDYQVPESGIDIAVTDAEIACENRDGAPWSDAYLESLAVYRKICEKLLDEDVILFHSSAFALEGKAYLLAAPSGTGKSTHARLWRQRFGSAVTTINDDKPLIHLGAQGVTVYGTPYGGKEGLHTNTSAPVAGIVLLHRAAENAITRLEPRTAYPKLLNQTYRRTDAPGMLRTMDLVHRLCAVPLWSLGCNISQQAVEVAYRALIGGPL